MKKSATMMKIIMVPLDDRPCTARFPRRIAAILRQDLSMPPAELLGHFLTPGNPGAVRAWLLHEGPGADHVIASLEMLCYGGLIASREGRASAAEAGEGLSVLHLVKQASPATRVFASSVIMRTSITTRDERTAALWRDMNRRSVLQYKYEHGLLSSGETRELNELTARIPRDVLEDYLRARARNHEINLGAVRAVASGAIDFLLLCQEDSYPWGPHRDEQERLLQLIDDLRVGDRVAICCGTDEAGMLLLARALNHGYGSRPRIVPVYYPDHAKNNIPLYEDRPMSANVAIHMRAIGAEMLSPGGLAVVPGLRGGRTGKPEPQASYGSSRPGETGISRCAVCLVHCPSRDPVDAFSMGMGYAPNHAPAAEDSDGPAAGLEVSCWSLPEPNPGSGCSSGDGAGPRAGGNFQVVSYRPGDWFGHLRTEDELLQALYAWRSTDTPVGVVDARFANGADPGFVRLLSRGAGLLNLAAYAGWNTAANSLGTVLAHLSVYLIIMQMPDSQVDWVAHYRFLVERFLDDFLYQTQVRSKLIRLVRGNQKPASIHHLDPEGFRFANDALIRLISEEAATFFAEHIHHKSFRIAGRGVSDDIWGAGGVRGSFGLQVGIVGLAARLPWERLFEVEVEADVAVRFDD